MKSSNMKAAVSITLIFIFSGCLFQTKISSQTWPPQKTGESPPDWYGADIKLLPIANNPDALAEIANALCVRSAPLGQKVYAMRLAAAAIDQDRTNKHAALALSRAAFLVADGIGSDEKETKKIAQIGVDAARIAGVDESNPEACYYFALNQGLIIHSQGLFAIKKLPEIVSALKIAQKDGSIDYAGPIRVLGILYLKAPAWPSGIGDLDKSLDLLEQAVSKEPAFPQNFIFYAEALIEDDNHDKALRNLDIAYLLAVPEIWGSYYSKKWRDDIDELKKKINKK